MPRKPKKKRVDPIDRVYDELGHLKVRCPYCNVRLAPGGVCLNLCLMPAGAARKFNSMLGDAYQAVREREEIQKKIQE